MEIVEGGVWKLFEAFILSHIGVTRMVMVYPTIGAHVSGWLEVQPWLVHCPGTKWGFEGTFLTCNNLQMDFLVLEVPLGQEEEAKTVCVTQEKGIHPNECPQLKD